jgi:hypothetical protein
LNQLCKNEEVPQDAHLEVVDVSAPWDNGSLKVQTLTGKTFDISDVSSDSLIYEVKRKIQGSQGIPPDQQRLVYQGAQQPNNRRLGQGRILNGSHLNLVLRLRASPEYVEPTLVACSKCPLKHLGDDDQDCKCGEPSDTRKVVE